MAIERPAVDTNLDTNPGSTCWYIVVDLGQADRCLQSVPPNPGRQWTRPTYTRNEQVIGSSPMGGSIELKSNVSRRAVG